MLVVYKKPNVVRFGGSVSPMSFNLVPGLNDVPNEKWEHASKVYATALKFLFDDDHLELVEDDKGAPVASASALTSLGERKAVALVRQTTDPELLLSWHAGETRERVQKAIEAQLDEHTKAAEPTKKGT